MTKKIFSFILLLSFSGCGAYTTIKTSKSPSAQNKIYQKLLIDVQGLSIPNKLNMEWTYKNEFEKNGNVQVVLSSDLFSPSKNYSDDQKRATVLKENIEGILIVNFTGSEKVRSVSPPGPVETKITKDDKGNETVTTFQRPGTINENLKIYHELTLLDANSFKPVWVGFADSNSDYKIDKSLASKTFSKMVKEGLIQKKNQ